ncbi:MAG: FGGY family carbohydrate kinase [Solirubrobacterales bacterium]
MAGSEAVLAIDQGTSATKALVVAPGGDVIGVGRAPVTPRARGDGGVEQDPDELLGSVIVAGREALAAAGTEVAGVGLGNQGETVLAWDPADGRALGPALSWQDRRATEVTDELAAHAPRLLELTGLPLDPYFAAPKLAWLRRREQGGIVTTIDAWVNHRLTGETVTDAATASRTLLLDLGRVEWSEEACALFGLEASDQPRIVDCDAAIGHTDAFGESLPIAGLAVDQQAALFAESCFSPGEAKCTYGTGAFVLATAGPTAPRSPAGNAACVAWRLGGETTYCLDGQVYTAGAAVSWLERLGLISEAEDLDRLADGAARDPDGVVFVPALAGLGAPFWTPGARAGWLGLSLSTERADLVGSLVCGLAAQVAWLARAMESDLSVQLERLRVDGGLTRCRALMQTQADLLQAPVELYPSPDATALGIAALARLAVGGAQSPEDAVGEWTAAATFEPRLNRDRAEERLVRWRNAATALAGLADGWGERARG